MPRSGKHPVYRGIRSRCGSWVSEIREPGKPSRIWLGTFPTAEMAAVAFDVAARALRGPGVALNFPDLASSWAAPASTSADDIRAAAMSAAASLQMDHDGHRPPPPPLAGATDPTQHRGIVVAPAAAARAPVPQEGSGSGVGSPYFLDEEVLFETPQFIRSMAAGMMLSPPRLSPNPSDDSPDPSEAGDSLWS